VNGRTRTSRSFTIMEMITALTLLGAFLLLAGPLTLHLLDAIQWRTKTYDQLSLLSQISDRIRSDLRGQTAREVREVLAVEAKRLVIGSAGQTIEYRTNDKQIERIESLGGKSRITSIWQIPYASLTFSRQQGKPGAVLVGLHWQLERRGARRCFVKKLAVEMSFAARERQPQKLEAEDD